MVLIVVVFLMLCNIIKWKFYKMNEVINIVDKVLLLLNSGKNVLSVDLISIK